MDTRGEDVGIPEYYAGKTIFITGGTGFMGKVLVEKLLYSCPGLERVYLLLRQKKGQAAEQRLQGVLESEAFSRLKRERPGVLEDKVRVIPGDVMELGLGISDEDRALLVNTVHIIFHVAASVRFDDPMKFAVTMNLRGTRELLELAKQVKNLEVLAHVSTSYSNTNRDPVEERLYPPHADWRDTIEVVERTEEHTLDILTSKYLGELPNTYTFTKQLAEHVMYEQKGKLPVIIFRPSIVISSVAEPVPGWIENFNGPVGLLVASGKGIMRSIYSKPDLIADYIPVDIAIKGLIVAAWQRGKEALQETDDVPIYNSCNGNIIYVTMMELLDLGREITKERVPLNDLLWNTGGNITTCKHLHYVKVLMLHLLPALFVDAVLMLMGKKPMLVKLQRRIYIANLALDYYITRQWTFTNTRFLALRDAVPDRDRDSFDYKLDEIDVYQFFTNSALGARRYLLREPDDTLPQAFVHAKRMYWLDKSVQVLIYSYLFYLVVHSSLFASLCLYLYGLLV